MPVQPPASAIQLPASASLVWGLPAHAREPRCRVCALRNSLPTRPPARPPARSDILLIVGGLTYPNEEQLVPQGTVQQTVWVDIKGGGRLRVLAWPDCFQRCSWLGAPAAACCTRPPRSWLIGGHLQPEGVAPARAPGGPPSPLQRAAARLHAAQPKPLLACPGSSLTWFTAPPAPGCSGPGSAIECQENEEEMNTMRWLHLRRAHALHACGSPCCSPFSDFFHFIR